MLIEITPLEARVIGSLIEKEITTPDQYPLSLSALTHACNQKSNRNPVMQLSEVDVQEIVDGLMKKHLLSDRTGFGSRVTKYQHRFCNVGFGSLEFSAQELGVLSVLESVLKQLMERDDGPFVVRLAREPGKRESRFEHLFSGESEAVVVHEITARDQSSPIQESQQRIEQLEILVMELEKQLNTLEARVDLLEVNSTESS